MAEVVASRMNMVCHRVHIFVVARYAVIINGFCYIAPTAAASSLLFFINKALRLVHIVINVSIALMSTTTSLHSIVASAMNLVQSIINVSNVLHGTVIHSPFCHSAT